MSAASSQPSGHAEALPFEPLREALLARGRRAGLFNACSALYTLLGLIVGDGGLCQYESDCVGPLHWPGKHRGNAEGPCPPL